MNKKLVITGGNGQLGRSIRDSINKYPNLEGVFIDVETLDLTDANAVKEYFESNPFDFVVNCAAYTAVDKAETDAEAAEAINVRAVRNIALAAVKNGIRVMHISTDYVFDGESPTPYKETDTTNPQTVYGQTKLQGERELIRLAPESMVIRTAWLYSNYGKNFFLTMKAKALAGEKVRVVADQRGCPTEASSLADVILRVIAEDKWHPGIYHFTGREEMSWYDFTREIYKMVGADPKLVSAITTSEFPALAKRPKYSVLDNTKIRNLLGPTIDFQK